MARMAGDLPPGAPSKRTIPKNYAYDPGALKPLAATLWQASVALGHSLSACRQFARVKSATVSPDGNIGGRGYVMAVKEVRQRLYDACESLSSLCDTLHDEINAPHWKPQLAQLAFGEREDVSRFIDEAEKAFDEADEEKDGAEGSKPSTKDWFSADARKGRGDTDRSELPGGGDAETLPGFPDGPNGGNAELFPGYKQKTAGYMHADHLRAIGRGEMGAFDDASQFYPEGSELGVEEKEANSSLPVETLPGGPRVEHLDRGNEPGPWGSWNRDEQPSQDRYDNRPRDYDYPGDHENELVERTAEQLVRRAQALALQIQIAESALPGKSTDTTPTDANDFGLGYGAKGDGIQHELADPKDPQGKGVWGPSSDLPDDPGTKTYDPESPESSDIEVQLRDRNVFSATEPVLIVARSIDDLARQLSASLAGRKDFHDVVVEAAELARDTGKLESTVTFVPPPRAPVVAFLDDATAVLPNDNLPPVARSDYFPGDKGNLVNSESGLPGTQMPAKPTPIDPHPDVVGGPMPLFTTPFQAGGTAESEMPGDGTTAPKQGPRDTPIAPGQTYEDWSTPYVRWEQTTHDYTPDTYGRPRPTIARNSDG